MARLSHRLVNPGRRWYLVAWDSDRKDWRTFRVDRIRYRDHAGYQLGAGASMPPLLLDDEEAPLKKGEEPKKRKRIVRKF